ncbi:unnamed protein product [Gordionus sp. m RMFG-2023]
MSPNYLSMLIILTAYISLLKSHSLPSESFLLQTFFNESAPVFPLLPHENNLTNQITLEKLLNATATKYVSKVRVKLRNGSFINYFMPPLLARSIVVLEGNDSKDYFNQNKNNTVLIDAKSIVSKAKSIKNEGMEKKAPMAERIMKTLETRNKNIFYISEISGPGLPIFMSCTTIMIIVFMIISISIVKPSSNST